MTTVVGALDGGRMKRAYSHADLVGLAERHLRSTRRCNIVLIERGVNSEIPDAIGWAFHSILIECKTSMSDYYADAKKPRCSGPTFGMGAERWYLTPAGLLKPELLRPSWGLLEARGSRVYRVVAAPLREQYDHRNEQRLLASELRNWCIAAAEGAPEMPTQSWMDKFTLMRNADIVRRHGEKCPGCSLRVWDWDRNDL